MDNEIAIKFAQAGVLLLAFFFGVVSLTGIIVCIYESIEEKYRHWFFENHHNLRKEHLEFYASNLINSRSNGHDKSSIHYVHNRHEDNLDS